MLIWTNLLLHLDKKTLNTYYIYLVGIFVWDYTIVYQLALVLLVAATIIFYYDNRITVKYIFPIMYSLLIAYFALHTFLGFSVYEPNSYDYLATMVINLFVSFAIIKVMNSKDIIREIMKACIVISFAVCLYAVIVDRENLLTGKLAEDLAKPFTGGTYDHNDLALLAGLSVLFLSYFNMEKLEFLFHFS